MSDKIPEPKPSHLAVLTASLFLITCVGFIIFATSVAFQYAAPRWTEHFTTIAANPEGVSIVLGAVSVYFTALWLRQ